MQTSREAVKTMLAKTVTLQGTISQGGYAVWVNGVRATDTGGGNWTAAGVPVPPGGIAVFAAVAIPLSDNDGNGTPPSASGSDPAAKNPTSPDAAGAGIQPEKPPGVRLVRGTWSRSVDGLGRDGVFSFHYHWQWNETNGGTASAASMVQGLWDYGANYWVDPGGQGHAEFWDGTTTNTSSNIGGITDWFWPTWSIRAPSARGEVIFSSSDSANSWHGEHVETAQDVHLRLRTSGRAGIGRRSVCAFTGWAQELTQKGLRDISQSQVSIPGVGCLGPDGLAYGVFADGQEFDVTPQVPAAYSYFTVLATQHKLVVECLSDYPTNKTRTTVGVAEDVSLAFQPPVAMGPGEQPWWLAFDGGVSSAFGSSTVFTAPSNAATAVVRVLVRAAQLDTTFRVLEPTGIRTSLGSPQVFDVGHVGVGMELNVFIEPVNVSFCKLHVMEIGEDATNVWGYFTNSYFTTSGLSHKNDGADVPHYVGSTNMIHEYGIDMFDWPRFDLSVPPAPPCTKGGYSWSIPAVWWVGDFFKSNSLPGWPGQNFELDDSGTATVEKFGWVATRATNERPSSARKQIQ